MKWLKAIIAFFTPMTTGETYTYGMETAARILNEATDKQAAAEMLFARSDGAWNESPYDIAFDSGISDWLYDQGYRNPRDLL
jgi:hypothetical protein